MNEKWKRILKIVIKFFKDTKLVSIVSLIAFIVSIITAFLPDCTLLSFIKSICYSVIAAYIFFIIQVYVPDYKRGNLIAVRLKGFLTGRVLDNLNRITRQLNKEKTKICQEDAESIVVAGSEAYDNLFRCIDFYSGSIEISLLDTLIGLSENQFLYNLYFAHRYMTNDEYVKWIYDSINDESGAEFLKLKEKLERQNSELPLYGEQIVNESNE